MDVKIGITHSPRELEIDSGEHADEVRDHVVEALNGESKILELTDRRGRQYLVPTSVISYVEIGEGDTRRVGFTASD